MLRVCVSQGVVFSPLPAPPSCTATPPTCACTLPPSAAAAASADPLALPAAAPTAAHVPLCGAAAAKGGPGADSHGGVGDGLPPGACGSSVGGRGPQQDGSRADTRAPEDQAEPSPQPGGTAYPDLPPALSGLLGSLAGPLSAATTRALQAAVHHQASARWAKASHDGGLGGRGSSSGSPSGREGAGSGHFSGGSGAVSSSKLISVSGALWSVPRASGNGTSGPSPLSSGIQLGSLHLAAAGAAASAAVAMGRGPLPSSTLSGGSGPSGAPVASWPSGMQAAGLPGSPRDAAPLALRNHFIKL